MIESKVRNRARYSTALLGMKQYSLEHVMPKKWENHWSPCESDDKKETRNKILYTLGNLTLITSSLNKSLRDASWEDKKNGRGRHDGLLVYAQSIDTFSKYLEKPEWDETVIIDRAGKLNAKAQEIWRVD